MIVRHADEGYCALSPARIHYRALLSLVQKVLVTLDSDFPLAWGAELQLPSIFYKWIDPVPV